MFEKVGSKDKLSQKIVNQIEKAIRNKELKPEDKIPTENELCDIFGVSRTVVREAIQKLDAKGLISIKKGSGIYVNEYLAGNVIDSMNLFLELKLNAEYICHVINIREILEPEITKMAAQNRTAEDLEDMEDTIVDLEECDHDNFEREGEIDKDFHLSIARASGNPLILVMLKPVFQLMPRIRSIVYKDLEQAKPDALKYHQKIYSMIKDQDEKGVYQAMTEHLRIAEEHSQNILEIL